MILASGTRNQARLDFLNARPPTNYIAGLGRGATGFTTRSDVGPARAGVGRGSGVAGTEEVQELGYDENQKFDEFEGNDVGLSAQSGEYDDADKEADLVWDFIDKRLDSRRKDRREARLKKEIEEYRASNPKITEQFTDLKRKLTTLSASEWNSIPESGVYVDSLSKNKKQRFVKRLHPPYELRPQKHDIMLDPLSGASGVETEITIIGEGRSKSLSRNLDRVSDSVSGMTAVDPKGYLTDLMSKTINSGAEISDIKKARLLLKSLTQTNPKKAPGWIAAARLEEVVGDIKAARNIIQRGCKECPGDEDVWLEACRLATPENSKAVLAQGVKANPNSVKLWVQAAELESDDSNKSQVLRKALEHTPDSVRIWMAVVDLAQEDDARLLLSRAVECCPLRVELWLALARLQTYDDAKRVLNKARKALPREPSIWITAAKLEEANQNIPRVAHLIDRAIRKLQANGVSIDRESWMKEAESAERAGAVATCQAIIHSTIGIGVEDEDRKRTWLADAEECQNRGSVETARAIFAHAITTFPGKKSVWLRAAQLEKSHGTEESLEAMLKKAVGYCPQTEVLWLMRAKEKWLSGDLPTARAILEEAYAAIPNSEEIWLAAFKLEFENHEPERTRMLLAKARARGGTERVWMKSAIVEREIGDVDKERELLCEALERFPHFHKLWLMLGQLQDRIGQSEAARETYEKALQNCPHSTPLWLSAAALEEKLGGVSKARAILTKARLRNTHNPELWLAAIRLEAKAGNGQEAESMMAKALQDCPSSGRLWAETIDMAPRPQRKSKSVDALKRCDRDPFVIAAVAKLFWQDRKVDKARNWLNRAVTLAPDVGDFWALLYEFELQHSDEHVQQCVIERCAAAEPRHGEKWTKVSKAVENAHLSSEAILKKISGAGSQRGGGMKVGEKIYL